MAHRRSYRRRARKNPLSDNTKIAIAVGVTAAVVGVGYFLYRRSQQTQVPMFAPGGSAQQGQGGVQSTPPAGAPQGGSDQTQTPPPALRPMATVLAPVTAVRAMPTTSDGVRAPRTISSTTYTPPVTMPTLDPNNPYG